MEWEHLLDCFLTWEYLLEPLESAQDERPLCCLIFSVLPVDLGDPKEAL